MVYLIFYDLLLYVYFFEDRDTYPFSKFAINFSIQLSKDEESDILLFIFHFFPQRLKIYI